MSAMNLNTNTYVIAIDNTSKSATLVEPDTNSSSLILYNGSDKSVFVVSGATSAPTAVFPTSATAPLAGKVIGPGATVLYTKPANHKYLAAIQATSGTGSLYISIGAGE